MPAVLRVPVTLEFLDESTARFAGADIERFPGTHWTGMPVEYEGKFPMVILSRDQWTDAGCPTLLIAELTEFAFADDSPTV